jgi:hypothetical protein
VSDVERARNYQHGSALIMVACGRIWPSGSPSVSRTCTTCYNWPSFHRR